jgi:hypothetical protein
MTCCVILVIANFEPITKYKEIGLGEKSYSNAALEKSLVEFSKPNYLEKVFSYFL